MDDEEARDKFRRLGRENMRLACEILIGMMSDSSLSDDLRFEAAVVLTRYWPSLA